MSLSKKPTDLVDDNEILYRRILVGRGHYSYENKELKISSQAFGDANCQPSVDRAVLCNHQPELTKQNKTDGVISLVTKEIRSEKIKIESKDSIEYLLDVCPDPLPDNEAHAIIVPTPEYRSKNNFKKVKERLAQLAKCVIEPVDN